MEQVKYTLPDGLCVVIGRIPIPQKFIDQQRRDDACIVFLVWILYFGSYFPIQLRKELNGGYDYAMVWLRETLRKFWCVRNVWSQAFQLERCGLSLHSPARSLRVCLSQFVVCHLRCPETEKGVSNFCNQVGAWGDTFERSGGGFFLVSQPRPPTSVRHASSANAGCSHVLRKCKSTRPMKSKSSERMAHSLDGALHFKVIAVRWQHLVCIGIRGYWKRKVGSRIGKR